MTASVYPNLQASDFTFLPHEYSMSFDDPNYVRADKILVDRQNGEVRILLQGEILPIGVIPEDLRDSFTENRDIVLKSTNSDGTLLSLTSRVVVV